jgi:hypothetical protein
VKEYLYLSTAYSPYIYLLYILPNGAIYDSFQHWTTNTGWAWDIAITPNKKYLYVGARWDIEGFQIDSTNGSLYPINTTAYGSEDVFITPNGEYLLANQALFRIDSTGNLLDTGSRYTSSYGNFMLGIDPRGNPLIAQNGFDLSLWIYHLDYASATFTHTSTINWGASVDPWKIAFTPDGSFGLMNGYLFPSYDVMVLKIDTTESVSSTGQKWDFGFAAPDVAVTPDGRFGLVTVDTAIFVLAIDTVNGIITDTGKRFAPPGRPPTYQTTPTYLRITEDGKMVVVNYDVYGEVGLISTAWLSSEGDLTWTGYTFPFGATYLGTGDGIIDIDLVPAVHVTGIDSIEWQLYP